MGCYDSLHVIGHSMGAHIAGHVGKNLPGLDRITGNLWYNAHCVFKISMLLKNDFGGSIDQFMNIENSHFSRPPKLRWQELGSLHLCEMMMASMILCNPCFRSG